MDDIIRKIKRNLNLNKKLNLPASREIKINFGCGKVRQPGYINVDIRNTEAVDIVVTLPDLSNCLEGQCSEVYLSHVLEHFGAPGKKLRQGGVRCSRSATSCQKNAGSGRYCKNSCSRFYRNMQDLHGRDFPFVPKTFG